MEIKNEDVILRLLQLTLRAINGRTKEIKAYVENGDFLSATTLLDCMKGDLSIASDLSASLIK